MAQGEASKNVDGTSNGKQNKNWLYSVDGTSNGDGLLESSRRFHSFSFQSHAFSSTLQNLSHSLTLSLPLSKILCIKWSHDRAPSQLPLWLCP
ncbi:hypothetical protein FH972_010799 [Carpinus fangiana]|uniref:Uncharacterized protein n=1 Tax=Carpinus fangiana TaxID=176857 RepID=A0A660KPB6_9ROSI|nr:hypothetical protein FH972_010799 [Carpinus fangiana]